MMEDLFYLCAFVAGICVGFLAACVSVLNFLRESFDMSKRIKTKGLDEKADELMSQYSHSDLAYILCQVERDTNKIKAEAVREAFKKAEIPKFAKAGCIGEFKVFVEGGNICLECYLNGDNEDCDICDGESENGLSDLTVDIPWTAQKEIFKKFCRKAAEDCANKLERG